MHREFLPYEQALELKQLGFDESCLAYYDRWNGKSHLVITNQSDSFISKLSRLFRKTEYTTYFQDYVEYYFTGICTAPTFSQAFRFFREKHKLHSYISRDMSYEQYKSGLKYDEYLYVIEGLSEFYYDNYGESPFYKTPEEAEPACLQKLIEIVKQNNQ